MACRALFVAGALGAALFIAVPQAAAQSTDARLNRLENEMQTLSRALFRGETPPSGALSGGDSSQAAAMEVRIQQLEREVRNLTGQIEQQNYEMRRFRDQVAQILADMEAESPGGEMSGAAGQNGFIRPGTAVPPPRQIRDDIRAGIQGQRTEEFGQEVEERAPESATSEAQGVLGTLRQDPETGVYTVPAADQGDRSGPEAAYENAFALLREREFGQSQRGFEEFLEKYPDHNLASNARYWLAETYYVNNDFERAARIFAETYQKDPQGPKGADSLLKLGMALAGIGNKDDACLTFEQLLNEYGSVRSPVISRARAEIDNIGCDL